MQNTKLYSLTLIALGAAIIAVLSPLAIPIGIVPVTLQTLAVGLVATVLKARETFFAILLYLLLGFIGIPVFTGGTSGIAVLFGPTGGFLLAFFNHGNPHFLGTSSNQIQNNPSFYHKYCWSSPNVGHRHSLAQIFHSSGLVFGIKAWIHSLCIC